MAEPDEADDGGVPGLAAKLEHLFATVPKPTGGRYSNESASQALAAAGVKVSAVHISHLRSGRRNNPSARLLAALAALFGVEIGYFFDPDVESKTNDELAKLKALSESRVQGLMARSGISEKNLRHMDAIIEAIRKDVERTSQEPREEPS